MERFGPLPSAYQQKFHTPARTYTRTYFLILCFVNGTGLQCRQAKLLAMKMTSNLEVEAQNCSKEPS